MTDDLAIGVDVGGTKIGFTLIDRRGTVHDASRIPTGAPDGPDAVMDRVAAGIRSLLNSAKQPVAGIGIGCPGQIDHATGVVREAANLGWHEVALRAGIAERLETTGPIVLGIDANANALGELYFGAARGHRDVIFVAIGTGLGGAAIADGALVLGTIGYAMEIGHVQLDPTGRHCLCGMRGCPEMYASGLGLLAGVQEHSPQYPGSSLAQVAELSPADILAAARARDELALVVITEAQQWLFRTLAYCVSLFNPELLVIGGGLGLAAADFFIDPAHAEIVRRTVHMSHARLSVAASQVNNSAIGAACLVWHTLHQQQNP